MFYHSWLTCIFSSFLLKAVDPAGDAPRRFYLFNRPGFFVGQLVFQAYPIVLTAAAATILLAVVYVMFVAKFVRQIIWTGLMLGKTLCKIYSTRSKKP